MIKKGVNYQIYFILFYGLVGISPFIPVMSSHIGSSNASLLRNGITVILIFMVLGLLIVNHKIILNKFDLTLLFFIIYGFFHIFLTLTSITDAFSKFLLVYLYPILALLVIIYVKKLSVDVEDVLRKVQSIFLVQGIIMLFFAVLEMVFQERILMVLYQNNFATIQRDLLGQTGIRLVSLMYNPINLGLFLNIYLVFLLYENRKSKFHKIVGSNLVIKIPLLLLTLFVILLTYSRISYVLVGVTLLVFIFFNIKKMISIKGIVFLMLLIPLIPIFSQIILENQEDNLGRRFGQLTVDSARENVRWQNWEEYISVISSKGELFLIWGGGLGTSNSDSKEQSELVKRVENSYISFLGEIGIIGLVIFLIILVRVLKNIYRLYKTNNQDGRMISQVLLVLLLAGTANDIFQNNPFSFYFWCIFCFLEVMNMTSENKLLQNSMEAKL